MIDSWMPRKLEPGFDATNSMLSDLITSTMKSPPDRSRTSDSGSRPGSSSRAGAGAAPARGPCAAAAGAAAAGAWAAMASGTRAAAPVTAAPFRKSRRSTDFFGMESPKARSLLPFKEIAQRVRDGVRALDRGQMAGFREDRQRRLREGLMKLPRHLDRRRVV